MQEYYDYKSRKGTFCEKVSKHQIGDRAAFFKEHGNKMMADTDLLLYDYIISKGETKEQVEAVRLGAKLLIDFYKDCYKLEDRRLKTDKKLTGQAKKAS